MNQSIFFGYLDNLNDQYVCCLTKKNVGQLILELQNSYGESFAAASVMTEKDFFQKENNYLEPIEISLTEYDEKFNILPPARTYGGFNFEMFMLPEQLGGWAILTLFSDLSSHTLKNALKRIE